jgi:hypothetical protein
VPADQRPPMNGESRGRYASLSPLSVPSAMKRLTLVAVTREWLSYARMPMTDHPDGAERLTRVTGSSLIVPGCRRLSRYREATSLNR